MPEGFAAPMEKYKQAGAFSTIALLVGSAQRVQGRETASLEEMGGRLGSKAGGETAGGLKQALELKVMDSCSLERILCVQCVRRLAPSPRCSA